jgi:hypothetical protein
MRALDRVLGLCDTTKIPRPGGRGLVNRPGVVNEQFILTVVKFAGSRLECPGEGTRGQKKKLCAMDRKSRDNLLVTRCVRRRMIRRGMIRRGMIRRGINGRRINGRRITGERG